MLPTRLIGIVPSLVLVVAPALNAAEPGDAEISGLKERIDALVEQVERLGKEKSGTIDVDTIRGDIQVFRDTYARDRERNLVTNPNGRFVSISGTLQARATRTTLENARGEDQWGFDLPLASIGVRGILYRDYSGGRNLEAQATLQSIRTAASYVNVNESLASGEWASDNSAANTPVAFADTFIRYNFLPVSDPESPRIQATFGQYIPRFGLEGSAPENLKPTIRGALFS
jgi:hypothetical protein